RGCGAGAGTAGPRSRRRRSGRSRAGWSSRAAGLRQKAGSLRVKIRRFRRNLVASVCRNTRDSAIIFVMDATDRKILAELQAQGRLTVTELAQRAGLSVAPCHRRPRELEPTGAVRGYP